MLEIILYILIGSAAGVLAFFSCMLIWDVEFKQATGHPDTTEKIVKDTVSAGPIGNPVPYLPPEPALRSSIPLQYQKIELTTEKRIVTGSYIDIERKLDGVPTTQRLFLN